MTIDEAEEILYKESEREEMSCFCHIIAPCAKCEGGATEEELEEARKVFKEYYGEDYK